MRFQAIVLVLSVVAAGCGSKKSASTAGGSGSTTTTTSGTTTTTTSTAGNAPSFASTKNCVQLESIGRKFAQAMAATSSTGKSSITDVAAIYKALASAAPSAIRPDFETIAAAFGTYADAVKKAGYTPGKIPTMAQIATLASLAKTFSSPKLRAAELHLNAWGTMSCGVPKTTTG